MFRSRFMLTCVIGCILSLCIVSVLWGCGGGGGSNSNNSNSVRTVPVSLHINWAERSRVVNGPASALSAVITLKDAAADGSDLTFTVNRDAAPATYTKNYPFPASAVTGQWELTVMFYAKADGADPVVGIATATKTVSAPGGSLGDVSTATTVAASSSISIDIFKRKLVYICGSTHFLTHTATDPSILAPASSYFLVSP